MNKYKRTLTRSGKSSLVEVIINDDNDIIGMNQMIFTDKKEIAEYMEELQ